MGKGGGGTNTTNTVTNSAPPADVTAQYDQVIAQANQTAATPYTTGGFNANNMVAGFSPDQMSAFNTVNSAQGMAQPYIAAGQADLTASQTPLWNGVQQYSPATMAQYANPYLNQAVGSTEAQMNNMDAQQQQQVVGNAISSGAWGGDRSAIAQSELANQQSLANNQTIANMENTGFNQQQGEFNTQQASQLGANEANAWLGSQGAALESGLGTSALSDTLQGASAQLQQGGLQQQLQQEQYNVPYEQFQAQQAYPFQTGSWLSDISEGIGGSEGGVGSASTTTPSASALSQLAGLGIGGYSLYQGMNMGSLNPANTGAAVGEARGGRIIKRAPGGFIPNFDMGGGTGGATPGFMPADAFMNGVPNASASYVGSPPALPHGSMGPPAVKAPSGSTGNATTTGVSEPGGLSPATMNAGMRLAGQAMRPTAASPGTLAPPGTLPGYQGMGDTTANYLTPSGSANTGAYVNAAGDSVQPGVAGMDPVANAVTTVPESSVGHLYMGTSVPGETVGPALPWQSGSTALSGTDLSASGAGAAGDAAATAGANAGLDAAATTAAADTATTAAADALPEIAEAAIMLAARGGAIRRAPGGFIPHYDDGGSIGGLTPAQTGANPFQGNLYNQFNNMTVEQLQQLNARSGGKNPTIMAALQKKQLSGGSAPAPQQSGAAAMAAQAPGAPGAAPAAAAPTGSQPEGILQQQGYARGGFAPRHYDAGGSDDTPSDALIAADPTLATPANGPIMSPGNDNVSPPAAASSGFSPAPTSGPAPLPNHDDFMKNYSNSVTNAQPYNQVNPWMALAQAGFGMAASRNPKILGAAGEGALEGMQNLTGQQKEAAAESERKGTLQEQGEGMYQKMVDARNDMNQRNEQMQETSRHNQAEEANQRAERQKPISDGFGGFLIPNPNDPMHPTTVYPGTTPGAGGDGSQISMQNVWKPPVGADGKPVTGEDYLKTIPPQVATEARLIQNGDKAPPSGFGSKNPVLLSAEAAAKNSDPSYVGTRYSTIQDFTKGTGPAATIQAQTAVMEHIPVLQKAMVALDNGDTKALNSLAQEVAKQTGSPIPTNFESGRNIVFDEVAKAVLGPRSTLADRQEFVKNASTSASGQQLAGQLEEAGKYIAGQQHALEARWVAGTGFDNNAGQNSFRERFINPKETPAGRALYEKYYPTPLPAPDKRVAGKTYYGPGGKPGTWTGTGWTEPQGAQ